MKEKSPKPALVALLAAKHARIQKLQATPSANSALNGQNRRVLGQHYRAKFGVK